MMEIRRFYASLRGKQVSTVGVRGQEGRRVGGYRGKGLSKTPPTHLPSYPHTLLIALLLLTLSAAHAQTPAVPAAASVAPAGRPTPVVAPATQPAGILTLAKTLALPNPGLASLDRRGTLYLADRDNNLRQLTRDGQPLNVYSPAQAGHVGALEAWNQQAVLVFYDDRQQVLLLDRFLAPLSEVRLADVFEGIVRTATLAPDGLVWLLDESTLSLRELDPQTLRLVQTTPLDLIIGRARPDFRALRFYQNNLYLVDHNSGIFVFDNLGNFRKKLPFEGLDFIAFQGDELVYLREGALHYFHLYALTERTQPLPAELAGMALRQVLLGEQYAYFVTDKGVGIYRQ